MVISQEEGHYALEKPLAWPAISSRESTIIRLLMALALLLLARFLFWFFGTGAASGSRWLYWSLTAVLLFKIFRWLHEWWHYLFISYPVRPEAKAQWTADMFTTYCAGEPRDMVKDTLLAMLRVRYPHQTYLCDESNDPELKAFCIQYGIHHITRTTKENAKAGNINHALGRSNGEICVILDPDHVPVPSFLDRVLPFFAEEKVGYVQCVQGYGNQNTSLVARAAAEQTYQFYGPLMMGMHALGTAQAIGANCTFRRKALESIGGHAAGLSEDMHTSMRLHAKGWKSVYLPEMLSRGKVPANLAAFFKQQLKWSRGTFELLFTVYPILCSRFSWQQKIHYFFLPLYYLYGLANLGDILIPSLSLVLAEHPWRINMGDFAAMFLPLVLTMLLVRMFAQRWLAAPEERGFHLLGGLLRMGTWYIYCLGLLFTLLRVKIPYIPTPKEEEEKDAWLWCLPSVALAFFGFASIIIGLHKDLNPYSIGMAALVGAGSTLHLLQVLLWQGKTLHRIFSVEWIFTIFNHLIKGLQHMMLRTADVFRLRPLKITAWTITGMILIAMVAKQEKNLPEPVGSDLEKNTGGFFVGAYLPETEREGDLNRMQQLSGKLGRKMDIVSIYQFWGQESLDQFPSALLGKIFASGAIPMITWEPYSNGFPEFKNDPNLSKNWKIFEAVISHRFDKYIMAYADSIRRLGYPVFIRFAHETDNPMYPWSLSGGGNTPESFKAAYRHVVQLFKTMGATNVAWVWNPWEENNIAAYYPGDDVVDWIGVTNLNYGLANSNGKWASFEDLYGGFHDRLIAYGKPVLLTEFGCTRFGGEQENWYTDAMEKIATSYPEIKGVVFFYSREDKNWGFTNWRPADSSKVIDWTFDGLPATATVIAQALQQSQLKASPTSARHPNWPEQTPQYRSRFIRGKYPHFSLWVNNSEFLVKGVAYNVNEDWRDVQDPLTLHKLERDFEHIKKMGANTIRKYNSDIYNQNVLNVAQKKQLKVIMGFWFEPEINYLTDTGALRKYTEKVISDVKRLRNHPALLAWAPGNEVWGLLKHHFAQPYLTSVRLAYASFIQQLVRKIHEADPHHPVITVAESSNELTGEWWMYHHMAPDLDILGVNAYYPHHIASLPNVQYLTDTSKPYLVSEFGPSGYWDSYYTQRTPENRLVEVSGSEKAGQYAEKWERHIAGKNGMNIGGIAYTWQDRREGTATWFGLTDSKGRLKPAYYSLQQLWAGSSAEKPLKDVYIFSPPQKIIAGQKVTFYAVNENDPKEKVIYEWELRKQDILEMDVDIERSEGGKRATLTLPKNISGLRMYLYVSDEKGRRSNSASLPLLQ